MKVLQRITHLFKTTISTCRQNKRLIIGYILIPFMSGPAVLLEIFINSWLYTYYDKVNGPIKDEQRILYLFEYQAIAGCLVGTFAAPIFGKIAD